MATIQYRNIYASGVLGMPQDTRDRADRAADVCLSDRVAVVVITTNGDELPTFEVIDVRKPKPPTYRRAIISGSATWLVVTSNGAHWRATSDDDARDTLRQAGGHAWRYDPDGTVTEVTP